ncbi:unnamed protein product, partial [marine sediment metagenome]
PFEVIRLKSLLAEFVADDMERKSKYDDPY